MAIESTGNALLTEMKVMAGQASSGDKINNSAAAAGGDKFGNMLMDAINRVNETSAAARAQTEAFQRGEEGIELHNVMIDNQKAGLAFEMAVQVRNRAVSAYQEIMNMPV